MTDRNDQGAASGLLGELESIRTLLDQNRRLQAGEPEIGLPPRPPQDADESLADDEIPLLQDEIRDEEAAAWIPEQEIPVLGADPQPPEASWPETALASLLESRLESRLESGLENRLETLVDDWLDNWLETGLKTGLQTSLLAFLQMSLQNALREWLDDNLHNEMRPLRDQLLELVREQVRQEARQLDALGASTPSSPEKTHGQ